MNLIELDKIGDEKSNRKKNFYSLTELGVFYVMRSPIFSRINIQNIIKKFPNLKIFEDLLYPFIKKDTLCSSNFPLPILEHISSYLQKHYLKIESFFLHTDNKIDWSEKRWILIEGRLQNYLIKKYKHKYNWLETAEIEQNFNGTIIKFFNVSKPLIYLEIRLHENEIIIYSVGESNKKRKIEILPNLKEFQSKIIISNEEGIDRAFSVYYRSRPFQFISFLLPALQIFNFDIAMLLSKDKDFVQSFDNAKEEFDKIHASIKKPCKYSLESIIQGEILRDILLRN